MTTSGKHVRCPACKGRKRYYAGSDCSLCRGTGEVGSRETGESVKNQVELEVLHEEALLELERGCLRAAQEGFQALHKASVHEGNRYFEGESLYWLAILADLR